MGCFWERNPDLAPNEGSTQVAPAFRYATADFTADLGYVVEIEQISAKVGGSDKPSSWSLRVTMIFRRESDGWKIVHRHADRITTPLPA